MDKTLRLFCIIVTYNGSAFIKKCLDHLKESISLTQVILIDNASQDHTVQIIEEEYSEVELIRLDRNYGFGGANNIGLKRAREKEADYVFLLNQDVYVKKDTISSLLELAVQYPVFGILSPMHLNGPGDRIDYHFSTYMPFQLTSDICVGYIMNIYPCNFVNAASWLLSKNCIETVGGFDPLFFHYGEDDDYINRVKFHKMMIGICPVLKINHDRGFYNALSSYPALDREYLEALKALKNINIPFHQVRKSIFLNLLCKMIMNLFNFNFKGLGTNWKVFFKIASNLKPIQRSRKESKKKRAFLDEEKTLSE